MIYNCHFNLQLCVAASFRTCHSPPVHQRPSHRPIREPEDRSNVQDPLQRIQCTHNAMLTSLSRSRSLVPSRHMMAFGLLLQAPGALYPAPAWHTSLLTLATKHLKLRLPYLRHLRTSRTTMKPQVGPVVAADVSSRSNSMMSNYIIVKRRFHSSKFKCEKYKGSFPGCKLFIITPVYVTMCAAQSWLQTSTMSEGLKLGNNHIIHEKSRLTRKKEEGKFQVILCGNMMFLMPFYSIKNLKKLIL